MLPLGAELSKKKQGLGNIEGSNGPKPALVGSSCSEQSDMGEECGPIIEQTQLVGSGAVQWCEPGIPAACSPMVCRLDAKRGNGRAPIGAGVAGYRQKGFLMCCC